MRIQNRKHESKEEENGREPTGEFRQDVGRLRAKNILSDATAEGRAQPFAFRTLHQDHQDHKQRHDHVNREEEIEQDCH